MASKLYDGEGRLVSPGVLLGHGGEGDVFEVADRPDRVVKIYHKLQTAEKEAKIAAMVRGRSERLLRLAAWPVGSLHETSGGPLRGLMMQKVSDHKEIHKLYSPKSRKLEFLQADWRFLVHTAGNVARAFAVMHEHGHVIGDVNHGNLLVSPKATVMLIDCDSFQIVSEGHIFRCEVGVSTYTPPELMGVPFDTIDRTPDHDNFGLAVLIFHLLFMGRHPFAGTPLDGGELPIEKAIQESRFAYGPNAATRKVRQPPGTLALSAVSAPVASLFERAFSGSAGERPGALEWLDALQGLSKDLRKCPRYAGHSFLASLDACPWCELENQCGVLLFSLLAPVAGQSHLTFNLAGLWSQITAIPDPGDVPAKPPDPDPRLRLSPDVARFQIRKTMRLTQAVLGVLMTIGACFSMVALSPYTVDTVSLPLLAFLGLAALSSSSIWTDGTLTREVERRSGDAYDEWNTVEREWRLRALNSRFSHKREELKRARDEHLALEPLRQQRLSALASGSRLRQLERFLDQYEIEKATIPGIGSGRRASLMSYGIESAADLSYRSLEKVPGFGPGLTGKLMAWRASLEDQFVFDTKRGIDPKDFQVLEDEFAQKRQRLEQVLSSGGLQLSKIRDEILHDRNILEPRWRAAYRTYLQAAKDVKGL